MPLLLALALLAQQPGRPHGDMAEMLRDYHQIYGGAASPYSYVASPEYDVSRPGLEFALAVEESIGPVAPPEPIRGMVARLGDARWRERERASGELAAYLRDRPGDWRWLLRARRDADREVGLRSHRVLMTLTHGGWGRGPWD
jgi:hypothetical protein